MDCIICLEEVDNSEFIFKRCKCKYAVHKSCYKLFIKKSDFSCPICRIEKRDNFRLIKDILILILFVTLIIYYLLLIAILFYIIKN